MVGKKFTSLYAFRVSLVLNTAKTGFRALLSDTFTAKIKKPCFIIPSKKRNVAYPGTIHWASKGK